MIKGNMDGLQVLKGGQGKATIYFSKEVMHGALDLNEALVVIGLASDHMEAHQEEGPTRFEVLQGMQSFLSDEIRREMTKKQEAPGLTSPELEPTLPMKIEPETEVSPSMPEDIDDTWFCVECGSINVTEHVLCSICDAERN